jgi:hypothetical protein
MPFEEAIRLYLESFRLPGEAQKIYRIMDSWSQHYFAQSPGGFANADAVHVLAFSVIILNTDQHNTTARRPGLPPRVPAGALLIFFPKLLLLLSFFCSSSFGRPAAIHHCPSVLSTGCGAGWQGFTGIEHALRG